MLENSAFSHEYFEGYNFHDLAYRKYPKIPFIPAPEKDIEILEDDGTVNKPFPVQKYTFHGDQNVFKNF